MILAKVTEKSAPPFKLSFALQQISRTNARILFEYSVELNTINALAPALIWNVCFLNDPLDST